MPHIRLDPRARLRLRESVHGTLICPSDEDYHNARKVWNGMIDRQPTLIVRCADAADVITAIQFAQTERLPVSVRGGGHSVGGLAVCDQGMVIDLSHMKGLEVDPVTSTARAEAGLTLGEFILKRKENSPVSRRQGRSELCRRSLCWYHSLCMQRRWPGFNLDLV